MAYHMTPATQSAQFSPFFLCFGREMRLRIDTSLIPRGTLSQDFRIHLSNVLQNLEVSRKIATEKILKAQDKYKTQNDKRTDTPSFQPQTEFGYSVQKSPLVKPPSCTENGLAHTILPT